MRILTIIPPYVPSYFNAGHHLPVFQVATFLRSKYPQYFIKAIDAAALNLHWKNICGELVSNYDVICVYCDFDGADSLERFIYYARSFRKDTRIIAFGRLVKQIPQFFMKLDLDAVHFKGDYELGLYEYIKHLEGVLDQPRGIMKKDGYRSDEPTVLNSEDWIMPDVMEIPYNAYNRMYSNDLDKFCGIPDRQELVVPVSRGCSINCPFCDVPSMQGIRERRYCVQKTVDYIRESFEKLPFKYVTFYSPTFTLNRSWVKDLCERLTQEPRKYPWKCTTALATLKPELIELMAKAGCVRISLGIESFSPKVTDSLPKCKQDSRYDFIEVSKICERAGIELNCFIILGLPGDSPEDAEFTIHEVLKTGARIRPTIYTPYQLMKESMDQSEIYRFNRQTVYDRGEFSEQQIRLYYNLFYNNQKDRATRVMEKI